MGEFDFDIHVLNSSSDLEATMPTRHGGAGVGYLNTFGKRVQARRRDLGMSQQELVDAINRMGVQISQGYWSRIENSERIPGGDVVAAAARVLDESADWLLMIRDDPGVGSTDRPSYFSEEADRVAEMVDALPAPLRLCALRVVRALSEWYQDQRVDSALRYAGLLSEVENAGGPELRARVEDALGIRPKK